MLTTPPRSESLPHTQAYLRWKAQTQAAFDFCVLVSHAVPALKKQIGLQEKGLSAELPQPDYYPHAASGAELRAHAQAYKQQLAAFLLVSLFSYFEAFVIDALKEMFDFHGGLGNMAARAEKRDRLFMQASSPEIENAKKHLRGDRHPDQLSRYAKSTAELAAQGYRFPSELLSSYGVVMLGQKLGNLRANDIPNLLRQGLHMDLSEDLVKQFHELRDLRNNIAHGRKVNLSIREVATKNEILKKLAQAIDRHLNQHFLIFEDYLK